MSLNPYIRLQIGVGVGAALDACGRIILTAIMSAKDAAIAAVALPVILCSTATLAATACSLIVGILADMGRISPKQAFIITAVVSAVAAVATIVALSIIGGPATVCVGVAMLSVVVGIANTFLAYKRMEAKVSGIY